MPPHTCDECGEGGFLHRHHEHHQPDVILYLCPPCHVALHRVRGLPRKPLFIATRGLSLDEAAAVSAISALRQMDPVALRASKTVPEIVTEFDRIVGMLSEKVVA